jgi:general secretion pathway protein M
VRLDLSPITNAYQRLSSRERTLLGGAVGAILLIGFYTLIWQPLADSQVAIAKRIQLKEHELVEMQQMRETYLDLLNQFELRQKIIERADPKFSLFPHIETTVSQVLGGREKIASMNPQNKDLSGAYREDSVELKLNGVTLQQLVDLMYRIEKGAQPLRLTRLSVKKRAREPQTFDVTATVSMLKAIDANAHPPEHPVEAAGEEPAPEGGGGAEAPPAEPPAAPPAQAPAPPAAGGA